MRSRWSLARSYGLDAVNAIAASAAMLEIALGRSSPHPDTSLWFAVPATGVVVLPVLARRRFPFAAPLSMWLLAAAVSFADGRLVVSATGVQVVGFAAAFMLGSVADAVQARVGLVAVLGSAAIIMVNDPERGTSASLVFQPLMFGLGWLAGYALRERAHEAEAAKERALQAERERDAATRLAVAEERARIARELHDIVAHAMSVIVLQVGAVRHSLPSELEQNRDALQDVERTGRAALTEMRRLLGAMRGDREELELTPQPGLGSLEPLLDEIRRAGLAVELHVEGEQVPLPDAIDLSAYRIVQEGLTNALKHAHASRADVVVRYRPYELQIDVRDDGSGPSTSDGRGHGLVGIRERVKLYGGQMTAGAANGRGFILSTRLPLSGSAR